MRGDPGQCCVAFLELGRKPRGRKRRVLDEHAHLAGAHHQIAQQALMVLEIADDPHAAMDEEQHARPRRARPRCHVLRRHDVERHRAAVLGDRPFDGGHAGEVDRAPVLQCGEDLLRPGLRQLPERAAVPVQLGEESPDLRNDLRIRGWIRGSVRVLGHQCDTCK
jgi:hypothetical protein